MQCKEIAATLAHQEYMQSFSVKLRGTHIYRFGSDGYNDERHVKLCAATNRHALPTLRKDKFPAMTALISTSLRHILHQYSRYSPHPVSSSMMLIPFSSHE